MTIKIKFHYVWLNEPPRLCIATTINDLPRGISHDFYILSGSIVADYVRQEHCDFTLQKIKELEFHKIENYVWEGQSFIHHMNCKSVTLEHTVFGVCPEWPLWTCPLSHYKAALQGWRKFLVMPKAIDSELIVELPEVISESKQMAGKNSHVAKTQRQTISENCQRKS